MTGEIYARGGSGAERHCSTTGLTSGVFQTILPCKELLYHFASPVRDLVYIVMDRSFFLIPVYLYSFAHRLITNTPTCHAGCSRGCPCAFKHGLHLAFVTESQCHKIGDYVDVAWKFPEKFSIMVHMTKYHFPQHINTTITCNALKKGYTTSRSTVHLL